MSKSPASKPTSIGFCGLLTILFIGLKLTGYISWSWWWVLAPLWLPVTLALTVALVCNLILTLMGERRK